MKTFKLILSLGNILFVLLSLYMALQFFLVSKYEQTSICLIFSIVSFLVFLQLTNKK